LLQELKRKAKRASQSSVFTPLAVLFPVVIPSEKLNGIDNNGGCSAISSTISEENSGQILLLMVIIYSRFVFVASVYYMGSLGFSPNMFLSASFKA
jgi:hypothetical protein